MQESACRPRRCGRSPMAKASAEFARRSFIIVKAPDFKVEDYTQKEQSNKRTKQRGDQIKTGNQLSTCDRACTS